ncbi:polyketide cyclase [Fusarium albosuccineum]|uniref:Polyketide cyclase n=1 Tax=Fusarium albosuccineum TaxID=1237068 RepID=A0A8H4PE73_9HYPO|nr:polyketide cyclase [Fusarium albosuccineum]
MASTLSREEIVSLFRALLDYQNAGKWEELEKYIQPTIDVDNDQQQRDTFIARLRSEVELGHQQFGLESYVVDVDSKAIAARIIKSETAQDDIAKTFEYQEITLAWFIDGRLSKYRALQDDDTRRMRQATAPSTPTSELQSRAPTSLNLRSFYQNYISSINSKSMDQDFDKFCQPTVTHNARAFAIPEYIKLISESQAAIKGLYFDVQDLLVDDQSGLVAARLEFTGEPVETWAGAKPNGKSVRFYEHVMYWLDGGKITWVWSIVDLHSYRRQLQL